jgi:hypothetical protein
MKIKHLIIIPILLQCYLGNAQSNEAECYFATSKDTVYCKELRYETTAQGYLKHLEYIDLKGNKIEFNGIKNVPDVLTFFMNGRNTDKTPLKPNKPDGYIRYSDRLIDGKIKVYLEQQGLNSKLEPVGLYRFMVKMPEGNYYKANSAGNMKKYIKPYLLKCKEFENSYKDEFSTREIPFMNMIAFYNGLCK